MRRVDGFTRFPFGNFDDRAIAGPHQDRQAIGHEIFFEQSRDAAPNQLEQLGLVAGLWSISNDYAYARHRNRV